VDVVGGATQKAKTEVVLQTPDNRPLRLPSTFGCCARHGWLRYTAAPFWAALKNIKDNFQSCPSAVAPGLVRRFLVDVP
jgi:hypothetical protein